MALYKFEVKLEEIFIRYVEVSAYRIKEAKGKADTEVKILYPKSYKLLKNHLYSSNEMTVLSNKSKT